MEKTMKSLKLLAFLSLLALAPATGARADNLDANNPNCSPGVKGCTANYPTSDLSKDNPAAKKTEMSPNCSPGEKGCTANYPTTDVTKKDPQQQQK
jgi:hypothetical protein